jgi:hypothetical protein
MAAIGTPKVNPGGIFGDIPGSRAKALVIVAAMAAAVMAARTAPRRIIGMLLWNCRVRISATRLHTKVAGRGRPCLILRTAYFGPDVQFCTFPADICNDPIGNAAGVFTSWRRQADRKFNRKGIAYNDHFPRARSFILVCLQSRQ